MFQLEKYIRPNLLALKPYTCARDEYSSSEGIFLDANENPFGTLNRYPDPHQSALKEKLALMHGMNTENIFIGNGSDEVIDLAIRLFCEPGRDRLIVCPPTYGMYEICAGINAVQLVTIQLNDQFQLNTEAILQEEAKMIFLCSPNNPTGNNLANLEDIVRQFQGIVFVDEAYHDFCLQPSLLPKVREYPNLIVSQTMSKAWGRAAIRIGIAYASKEIVAYLNKIKPPYNVSQLNQMEAVRALEAYPTFYKNKEILLSQRRWLMDQLTTLPVVDTVYPSDANFFLVKFKKADSIFQQLMQDGFIVRNRNAAVKGCLRITVGSPEENSKLIAALKKYQV